MNTESDDCSKTERFRQDRGQRIKIEVYKIGEALPDKPVPIRLIRKPYSSRHETEHVLPALIQAGHFAAQLLMKPFRMRAPLFFRFFWAKWLWSWLKFRSHVIAPPLPETAHNVMMANAS